MTPALALAPKLRLIYQYKTSLISIEIDGLRDSKGGHALYLYADVDCAGNFGQLSPYI